MNICSIQTLQTLLSMVVVLSACTSDGSSPSSSLGDSAVQTIAASTDPGRVLIIGLDGTRSEVISQANTPHLFTLAQSGFFDLDAITGDVSLSGPGWSSMLTGVWCDKHKVIDNDVTWNVSRFDLYPHFFERVKAFNPSAQTVSISHWAPINDKLLCKNGQANNCRNEHQIINAASDLEVKNSAITQLTIGNPTALFLQFDDIDHAGHGDPSMMKPGGFCPNTTGTVDGQCTVSGMNTNYVSEVKRIDSYIGEVLTALYARPDFNAENWLILASPDHGGGSTVFNQHGFNTSQDRRTFIIVNGKNAAPLPGKPVTQLNRLPNGLSNSLPSSDITGAKITDVAATALFHLGIPIQQAWGLSGLPVGVKGAPAYQERSIPSCYSTANPVADLGK